MKWRTAATNGLCQCTLNQPGLDRYFLPTRERSEAHLLLLVPSRIALAIAILLRQQLNLSNQILVFTCDCVVTQEQYQAVSSSHISVSKSS